MYEQNGLEAHHGDWSRTSTGEAQLRYMQMNTNNRQYGSMGSLGCLHGERMSAWLIGLPFLPNPDFGTRATSLLGAPKLCSAFALDYHGDDGVMCSCCLKGGRTHSVTSSQTMEAAEPHVPCTIFSCKRELHTHVHPYKPMR